VAIAMGNSGEGRFVAQLSEWAVGEDEVLAEVAVWAMRRIESGDGREVGATC
jgi:epoxyqueuosine reductase